MAALTNGVPTMEPHESRGRDVLRGLRRVCRTATSTTGGWISVIGLALVILIVLIGPLVAPYKIDQVVGVPFAPASAAHLLGTDYLGRDTLSRFLHGGGTLMLQSLFAPLVVLVLGGLIGTLSGSLRGRFDLVTMWLVDVVLSLPGLVLALIILAGLGTGPWSSLVALVVVLLPSCIRVVRSATMDASTTEFVEAALARGESRLSIAVREILPNTRSTLAADFGVRVAFAALIYSGLAFLGVSQSPPAADWGLMINENRIGLMIQPLAVLAPAAGIALFTVSVTIVADSIARSVGRRI